MNLKERAKQLKTDLPAVFLALKKKETPIYDFIPVLGYIDDLIILPALVTLTVKMIPKEIFDQCRIDSEGLWANGKPKKWYYAIPIVVIWLLILFLIAKSIWPTPHNG